MEKYELMKKAVRDHADTKTQMKLYLKNGFQMRGTPTGELDGESFTIIAEGRKKLMFFDAISTVDIRAEVRSAPLTQVP